jgi:oligopeptide/dipeptide ABC transporter ATP-binding protein
VPLLEADRVTKTFQREGHARVHALNGVSVSVEPGEAVGVVGESGSGKSTLGRLIIGTHRPDSGAIRFRGEDLGRLDAKQLRKVRGEISIVFQEPHAAFDPRWTVGSIVGEPLLIHRPDMTRRQRRERVIQALRSVTLDESMYDRYPRSLSTGQAQRVGIARATVTDPKLIVLDEPTSSLDLSIRAQILRLLARLQKALGVSYLLISHDIRSVRATTQRTVVMYLGQVMESGPTETILNAPRHPYTQMLLDSETTIHPRAQRRVPAPLGEIPSPTQLPTGCFFYSRCPLHVDACAAAPVPLRAIAPGHEVACIRVDATARGGVGTPDSQMTVPADVAPVRAVS